MDRLTVNRVMYSPLSNVVLLPWQYVGESTAARTKKDARPKPRVPSGSPTRERQPLQASTDRLAQCNSDLGQIPVGPAAPRMGAAPTVVDAFNVAGGDIVPVREQPRRRNLRLSSTTGKGCRDPGRRARFRRPRRDRSRRSRACSSAPNFRRSLRAGRAAGHRDRRRPASARSPHSR